MLKHTPIGTFQSSRENNTEIISLLGIYDKYFVYAEVGIDLLT